MRNYGFRVSDIDSTTLSIVLASLPTDGALQVDSGTTWVAVTIGQTMTADDIAAGHLRFVPAANTSGYASFDYRAFDGELGSDTASMFIDIIPVADAPTLSFIDTHGGQHELFRTGWENVADRDNSSTLVSSGTLAGMASRCGPTGITWSTPTTPPARCTRRKAMAKTGWSSMMHAAWATRPSASNAV
ncbi:hypothetical protein ASD68_03535 [Rhodanobacter sp. Root627]|uniref:hypothetical protein n=1 Tax=Rhodanobacter sp. Root627 TaxID=1736572 RepID=UPI0007018638|nr:hypothetical protein [Rhodanobacter sp. Root627]KRA35486.1 hypothetical protein ASD68_03535 [Rhodanobacter sp. Root627]